MNHTTPDRYCQSCGLPLRCEAEVFFHTHSVTGERHECCQPCAGAGEYEAERSVEDMVGIWVENTDWYNRHTGTDYSPAELRAVLAQRLPTLSRWKQKVETGHAHEYTVGRITRYIGEHLSEEEEIDAGELAGMSHLSPFHFRRVFKEVTGENVAGYIRRLRLEQIAHLALTTSLTLDQIATRIHYQNKSSLAKAFKRHFGVSVSEYRRQYGEVSAVEGQTVPVPEIRRIEEMDILCVEVGNTFRSPAEYRARWNRLFTVLEKAGMDKNRAQLLSVSLDDPLITPAQQCRYYLGAVVAKEKADGAGIPMMRIPGGRYAVFGHTGTLDSLRGLYRRIYEEWLPGSAYRPGGTLTFELYLNQTGDTDEISAEVYLPVENKP